ncbi:hypothetical protein COE15_24250 [Bacillus cereus]|uniref:hypothetical protein n=1 Tax=Bacillus sp. AFS023182 TaxID=2033492 RepID=UPI000BF9B213|nr:hypothetical protein [Bacillus sp. AFS023182]PFE03223.1 hypothetical protein CN288_14400 [Bacillus sp. AFS023182]PGX92117.1 hypothetical protein COE15_24250 [Bacillus cereus]
MNKKATVKIGVLFTILLIVCVFYGYKSLNSFLLWDELGDFKMISSDKEVADGIYFVRGKIYSEHVTGDETLLADGYAVVNRIQKKKTTYYTQTSAPNRSLWSNGQVTAFYNEPIHIGNKELKLINKENVSLETPFIELNSQNVISTRINDIQANATKLADGKKRFYSFRAVENKENVVVLGSVDGKIIKELPNRYGKSVYIGNTKEQIIDRLKSENNKNWIYFSVLVVLTSISGFVLYMYGKGKWTKDVFVFTFFGRKIN